MKTYRIADAPFILSFTDARFKNHFWFPWKLESLSWRISDIDAFNEYVKNNFNDVDGGQYWWYWPEEDTCSFLYRKYRDGKYIDIYCKTSSMTMLLLAYPEVTDIIHSHDKHMNFA